MSRFRFENLEVWVEAVKIGGEVCQIADRLDGIRSYRFAEQLRREALSISNNIAEGSGSVSPKDFAHFLNIARRSVYECAGMILFLKTNGVLSVNPDPVLETLRALAPKLSALAKTVPRLPPMLSPSSDEIPRLRDRLPAAPRALLVWPLVTAHRPPTLRLC